MGPFGDNDSTVGPRPRGPPLPSAGRLLLATAQAFGPNQDFVRTPRHGPRKAQVSCGGVENGNTCTLLLSQAQTRTCSVLRAVSEEHMLHTYFAAMSRRKRLFSCYFCCFTQQTISNDKIPAGMGGGGGPLGKCCASELCHSCWEKGDSSCYKLAVQLVLVILHVLTKRNTLP